MEIRFYLTPYGPGYHPLRPAANCSKGYLYINRDEFGEHLSKGEKVTQVPALPWKPWCLARIRAEEATHTAIQADAEIRLLPFYNAGGDYLPLTAQVLDVAEPYRSNIATWLEDHRIPADWITGTTTLGQVLRRIIQVMYTVQRMQEDFPEYDLAAQVKDIPAQQRQRVLNWMGVHGIETSDVNANWTVRQVLRRIVRDYPWRPITKFGSSLL